MISHNKASLNLRFFFGKALGFFFGKALGFFFGKALGFFDLTTNNKHQAAMQAVGCALEFPAVQRRLLVAKASPLHQLEPSSKKCMGYALKRQSASLLHWQTGSVGCYATKGYALS